MFDAHIVAVDVADLEHGMYITRLDRPWSETSFLIQGFKVESDKELEQLQAQCRYVYVDVDRSSKGEGARHAGGRVYASLRQRRAVDLPAEEGSSRDLRFRHNDVSVGELLFPHRKLRLYSDTVSINAEMPVARAAYEDLRAATQQLMDGYRKSQSLDIREVSDKLKPVTESIIRNPDACSWLARIKSAEDYACTHSVACVVWAVTLGRQLGLPKVELQKLALGSLLFDIGKVKVPEELIAKPGSLNKLEFKLMRSHVEFGLELLNEAGVNSASVLQMVEHHHERYAGHGYPKGLQAEEIPEFARIAAIVDCYDAITSPRLYAKPMSPSDAAKSLMAWRDIDFQAELVEEFIQCIGIYPAGTLVELSSGEVGIVYGEYRTRRLRPLLMMVLDSDRKPLPELRKLDLTKQTKTKDGKPLEIITSLVPGSYGIDLQAISL